MCLPRINRTPFHSLSYAVTPSLVYLAYSPDLILLKYRQETVKNKISQNTFSDLKQRDINIEVLT